MAITESSSQQQTDRKNQLVHSQENHNNIHVNMNPEPLNFDECFKDSPKFRQDLKDNLAYVENLETCMNRTIKQITNYIETGRDHIKAQQDFINSMKLLNGSLGAGNLDISKRINTLLGTLDEIRRLHEIVIDQSARTVGTSLTKFINDDLLKIKEARKSFDKISHEYDQALTKYSQPVKRQQDDYENLLIATSTAFTHTSLDLSIQLTALQSKKGSDLFEDLKPHISDMGEYISNIEDEFETLVRSLPSKHLMVSNNQLRPLSFDGKAQQVHLEGYLFKRASNGFKVWNRRWFILKDHQLLYQKRGDTQPTIMEEDLRLLTVRSVDKADGDRRFCFEILSPQKSHILQADSEAACKTWISAIQAGINAAFHDTEHKIATTSSKGTSNNESSTGSGSISSWGSGFPFKALQQATSKLNSITSMSETSKTDAASRAEKIPVSSYNDNEDGGNEISFKVDDQGRSYAPLRDDCDDDEDKPVTNESASNPNPTTTYPAAADSSNTCPPQQVKQPPVKPQRAYMIILAMDGNDTCADCGATQPKWASINLGITLCIECAGIHRSLGVHLSKVRSLTLDTEVWSPEIVQLMLNLGNSSVNAAYMACYRGQPAAIDADSSREERENWIKSKYLLKRFMRLPNGSEKVDGLDDDSSLTEDTSSMEKNNKCFESTSDEQSAVSPVESGPKESTKLGEPS